MKMLRITAKKDGFRRAGIEHGTSPTEHKADDFKPAQIEAMKAEPMLVVEEFEGKPPKEEKSK